MLRRAAVRSFRQQCAPQVTQVRNVVLSSPPSKSTVKRHHVHTGVKYMSKYFMPLGTTTNASAIAQETSPGSADETMDLLLQGGYITQSSSGVYTFLPNGLRLIKQLESIIDSEMESIGSSRMEMPILLSSQLWKKSGRLTTMGSELYQLKDRKDNSLILAPTHEEEVTKTVGSFITSYKHLPVRVYQLNRKFRDEPRPRSGLLRTKEFIMKDAYSFDTSVETATEAYFAFKDAYSRIMDRIFSTTRNSWKVAEADTGSMGGKLSHEYHVQDPAGEDELITCTNSNCGYTANAELAKSKPQQQELPMVSDDVTVTLYAQSDDKSFPGGLTAVIMSSASTLNQTKLNNELAKQGGQDHKQIYPGPESDCWDYRDHPDGPLVRFNSLNILADQTCYTLPPEDIQDALCSALTKYNNQNDDTTTNSTTLQDYFSPDNITTSYTDLRLTQPNDTCTQCHQPTLNSQKSIEIGHTFLLGTRYSSSLGYQFATSPTEGKQGRAYLQMGCYGIGITRLVGVIAMHARRAFLERYKGKGFIWPRHLAPFTHLIIVKNESEQVQGLISTIEQERDTRVLVDDRSSVNMGQKLKQADLLGAPNVWIVGAKDGKVEKLR
ncbi:unnamed protein product [Sympodiomycopsis kandeliae]